MSGYTEEAAEGFKAPFEQLKREIEKKFPREEVLLEEKYLYDVEKGHRLRLRTYVKNRDTNKITTLDTQYVKVPKHVPTWITKHDLWHKTKEEIDLLSKLTANNQEKNPSKKTINLWTKILQDNVRKANNDKKQLPIPKIR